MSTLSASDQFVFATMSLLRKRSNMEPSDKKVDGIAIGRGILGFIFPIVGIILMFAWLHYKPKASSAADVGALIGIIVALILSAQ